MSNQFTVYSNTDASAPVLAPTAGSAIALLDACLVNGYGAKPAAGWAKVYSAANVAVYQATTGSRMYLRIQDDATTAPVNGATAVNVFLATAYESMTGANAGTHPWPDASLQGVAKTGLSGRPWRLVADGLTFYFFTDESANGVWTGFMFGEFYSFVANDAYRSIIRFSPFSNSGFATDSMDAISGAINAVTGGAWIPRGHTAVLPPVNVSITGDYSRSIGQTALKGLMPFPNPADGGLYLSPVWISDPSTVPVNGMRGRMRGFWQLLHPIAGFADGDTFSGTGDLAGRTFRVFKQSGNSGIYVMETSATLETN